jgi:hypothetical protein
LPIPDAYQAIEQKQAARTPKRQNVKTPKTPKDQNIEAQNSKPKLQTPNSERHPSPLKPKQSNHQVKPLFTTYFILFGSILASEQRLFHPDTALRCESIAGEGRQARAPLKLVHPFVPVLGSSRS